MNEPNVIKRIYLKSAKLNLYFSTCTTQIDRIYEELKDIDKDVKEALDIVSRYKGE